MKIASSFTDINEALQFRVIFGISLALLLIKLIILFGIPIIPHAIEDWYIASNIASGSGYSLQNGPTALKTPIYPLFLTPWAIFGEMGKMFASAAQHLLWFIAAILFHKAAFMRFGKGFAFISTLFFALHPAYAYYPYVLESTSLTVPLVILYWYLSEYAIKMNMNVIYPMLIGWITALSQPILLPGIIALQIMYFGKRALILKLLLSMLIVFAPWTIRNAMEFGAFIPSKSPMWMNIYEGMKDDISKEEIEHIESVRKYMNDIQLEQEYKPIVFKQFRVNMKVYLSRSVHRFKEFWFVPDRYADKILSPLIFLTRILPQLFLGFGFLLSFYVFFTYTESIPSGDWKFLGVLIFIICYTSLIYSLTQADNIRFKLDVEWMQILLLFPIFQAFPRIVKNVGTRN
jgi:hypothetical protein